MLVTALVMPTMLTVFVQADDWTQTSQSDFIAGAESSVDVVSDPGNVTLSQVWHKAPPSAVMSRGPGGSWDDVNVHSPAVLYNGTNYSMWYSGFDGGNWRIGFATSPDGILWTKSGSNPVLDLGPVGSWDDRHIYGPTVVFDGIAYNMWYSGFDGGNWRIGYALSYDAVTWVKFGGGPVLDLGPASSWDGVWLFDPYVIYSEGKFRMWYGGYDGFNWRIGYASSVNGIDWTKFAKNPVLGRSGSSSWDGVHVQSPAVHVEDGKYCMWYTGVSTGGNSRVGHASSPDGANWTKYVSNPVLHLGPAGSWDDVNVYGPTVLYDGITYEMWFGGYDGSNWRIGHATKGYPSSGSLASSVFDSEAYGSFWNFINWTEYLPPETNITLATRSSNSPIPSSGWSPWSAETWNETGFPITSPRGRYVQYRATLTTANLSLSPILSEVNVNYTRNAAEAPLLLSPTNNTWTKDNTPNLTWSFSDLEGDSQGGFVVQIDDNSTFTSIGYQDWNYSSNKTWWTPSMPIADGSWYWRMRVKDSYGQWSDFSDYSTLKIDTLPPSADAGFDISVDEDEIAHLNASASKDLGLIAYYNWSFGDGNYDNGTSPTPGHSYTRAGIYSVILNVTDHAGFWDVDSVLVFVSNMNPVARAGPDITVEEGQTVSFDGSASYDTQSDNPNLIHTWYFGDGTVGSGITTSHTYNDDGAYLVTLVVTDDDGAASFDTLTATVTNENPRMSAVPPQTAVEESPFVLQITAEDVSGDKLTFSDNSTMLDIDPASGIVSFFPSNSDVGVHFIKVEVMDDDGGISSVDFTMTIQNVNDGPIITSTPLNVAMEETVYEYHVRVWDDDFLTPSGDEIVYNLDVHPPGMNIYPSGLIAWTPTKDQGDKSWNVVVNASDGEAYELQTFVIEVQEIDSEVVNHAPVLENPQVTEVPGRTNTYLFTVVYKDTDGDPPEEALVVIDGTSYDMSRASEDDYEHGTQFGLQLYLPARSHTYWFKARDINGAYASTSSEELDVTEAPELDLAPILLTILIIVGVVLIILQILLMRRTKLKEKDPPSAQE
jgi:predicted GH43/DUF377 family glycosyl hydrolase